MKINEIENVSILVVDDHQDIREMLSCWFTEEGFRVNTAADGVQALDSVLLDMPDVILTDCHMPNMSGIELSRVLRARKSFDHVPIVLISAAFPMLPPDNAGINLCVSKPFAMDYLLSEIKRLLSETARQKRFRMADGYVGSEMR